MIKTLYSILTVSDPKTGAFCLVVCETKRDELDVLRNVEHAGHKVLDVTPNDDSRPITLNDYEL